MSGNGDDISDSFGLRFFSRSLFRSGYFVTATLLFIAVVLCAVRFLWMYRPPRLPSAAIALLLIVVVLRPIQVMWTAIARHKSIRKVCMLGQTPGIPPQNHANAALDVAARAIIDHLFDTFVIVLVFLFVISLLLRHAI